MSYRKIGIVGLGLIGGSLAAAFKNRKIPVEVVGFDRPAIIAAAIEANLISAGFNSIVTESALKDIDLVILALPIRMNIELLPQIASAVRPGTLITDVSSTKEEIVRTARSCLPEGVHFLGGHPMAGSEESGLAHSNPLLFENAVYVLTGNEDVPRTVVDRFVSLLESIGARIIFMSPDEHDKIAAAVSHLPQMLAITLMKCAAALNVENSSYLKLAAGGFRDMTRIASSPYRMWADIIATNEANILHCLDYFVSELQEVRRALTNRQLEGLFEEAARNRQSIPRDSRGFLKPHFDLAVTVEDKPGVIAKMANVLADRGINIKDIEVLKVREDAAGTIRLAFADEGQRKQAVTLLSEAGFEISRMSLWHGTSIGGKAAD